MTDGARKILIDPLVDNNPVTLQVLGICSALAVTTSLLPALLMCAAMVSVATLATGTISSIRHYIPNNIRIIVQMTIIASFVLSLIHISEHTRQDTRSRMPSYA